ncbi:hypothetical protein MNV84_03556 [Leishmania braziliensis]|nr:hypothetical protein MNV84_03556 [Leishmania braziliensis]
MAKKKSARHTSVSAATADGGATSVNEDLRPVFAASTRIITAQEALYATLEQLDSIAQEAHAYMQQLKAAELNSAVAETTSPPLKRARDDDRVGGEAHLKASTAVKGSRLDVFAAMSALQYQGLCAAVVAYGLQLLPSLEDILKRVALAVLTPWLSTPEAWETLAMLCTTYRAGAAHALTELLESLLREPGVLLLDAPQLVPPWYAEAFVHVLPSAMASNTSTAALGGLLVFAEDQRLREEPAESVQQAARIHTDRTARKLRALVDMLYAAGGYVPAVTLQQAALRHAIEVVEDGVLPCYLSEQEYSGAFNTASTLPGTAGDATGAAVLRWGVPAAWHAASLQLLEAFLFICRPGLPAQLLATTTRAINVLAARLHRGVPVLSAAEEPSLTVEPSQDGGKKATSAALPLLPVTAAVGAAVVRLGHVLQLLRHPVALPPLQPAQLVVEKAKRRTFVPAGPPVETVTTPSAHVMTPPPQRQLWPVASTVAAPAPADAKEITISAVPAVAAASTRTPAQKYVPPVATPPAPQPVKSAPHPQLLAAVDNTDDDIPDIVMDD